MKSTVLSVVGTLLVLGHAAEAQSIYKAGTFRYKRGQSLTMTATVGGQDNTSTISTDEHLTLTLTAKGRDTLDFTLAIDSSSVSDGGGGGGRGNRGAGGLLSILGGGGRAMDGQALRGAMTPSGRFHDEANAPVAAQAMRQFLIALPTTLRAGAKWTDTMPPLILPFGGPNVEGSRIAETEVVRDTTYAGQRAWKLRRTVVLEMSASAPMGGRSGGGMGEVFAEGAGDGTFYISTTGVFLGGSEIMDVNVSVSLGPNLQIPVVIRQENTIAFVR